MNSPSCVVPSSVRTRQRHVAPARSSAVTSATAAGSDSYSTRTGGSARRHDASRSRSSAASIAASSASVDASAPSATSSVRNVDSGTTRCVPPASQ